MPRVAGLLTATKMPMATQTPSPVPEQPDQHATWKAIVREALRNLGGTATLPVLYRVLEEHPKAKTNFHYRAKVRKAVQSDDQVERLRPGIWRLKHY